jgi:hypothetical protein
MKYTEAGNTTPRLKGRTHQTWAEYKRASPDGMRTSAEKHDKERAGGISTWFLFPHSDLMMKTPIGLT